MEQLFQVVHQAEPSLLHRQAGLGAVERLRMSPTLSTENIQRLKAVAVKHMTPANVPERLHDGNPGGDSTLRY